jgi:transcriptional regulator GlxA family with amidase domain
LLQPGERVDELAAALGFSERQLRRRFLAAVGYGPKTLQRVLRLRRFLAERDVDGLAAAAVGAGYADQAHLARDCRALTGLTPGQLTRGRGQLRTTGPAAAA